MALLLELSRCRCCTQVPALAEGALNYVMDEFKELSSSSKSSNLISQMRGLVGRPDNGLSPWLCTVLRRLSQA